MMPGYVGYLTLDGLELLLRSCTESESNSIRTGTHYGSPKKTLPTGEVKVFEESSLSVSAMDLTVTAEYHSFSGENPLAETAGVKDVLIVQGAEEIAGLFFVTTATFQRVKPWRILYTLRMRCDGVYTRTNLPT